MFTTDDILKATGGKALTNCPKGFKGISTDSRTVGKGELFIPLVGARFDGHEFIGDAFKRGASGAIVEHGRDVAAPDGKCIIEAKDTLRALQDIAHYIRAARKDLLVVGVTGTNGKTTTKEMLASVLSVRGEVLKNEGNLNNEIGLPLTLLRLEARHWAAVLEMGMSAEGEIRRLARIAEPSVGLITNVGPAHLLSLGSLEAIARAKGELVDELPADGLPVLNMDDPHLQALIEKDKARAVTFGVSEDAGVGASEIEETGEGVSFRLRLPGGSAIVSLPVIGAHNVSNALGAAAAAWAVGMSLDEITEGLRRFSPVKMRMETVKVGGATVINDAYNANPASMAAALTALASMRDCRRMAVLGDMLELGEAAARSHKDAGRLAGSEGLSLLVVMGGHAQDTADGAAEAGMDEDNIFIVQTPDEAAAVVAERLRKGDCLLVKGSRGMKMERVVDAIKTRRLVA